LGTDIWNTLIDVKTKIENLFDDQCEETFEPNMESFNIETWTNRTWTCDKFRRAHLEVIDVREDRKMWIMHCCIFPHLNDDSPIFGIDVISGKNKITGFFLDFSPTHTHDHVMSDWFKNEVSSRDWKKQRNLPEWAKQIFSEDIVAAGNVNDEEELKRLTDLSVHCAEYYLKNVGSSRREKNYEALSKSHYNRYAHFQKQNPHTAKTLKALGFNSNDVDLFIEKSLFPEI
jgi:hypothetical protein